MGFLDFLKVARVVASTATKVRDQRRLARELAAKPMPEFVAACLANLNQSAGNWTGRAREPNTEFEAISQRLGLPAEVTEFYSICDGYESTQGEFPAAIRPIGELQTGAEHAPPISQHLMHAWDEDGNESDKEGMLAILPPDDLPAVMSNSTDSYLSPLDADKAIVLTPVDDGNFDLLLLVDQGHSLRRGTVLEVEGGSATRYPNFKTWLATRASLFGAMAAWSPPR